MSDSRALALFEQCGVLTRGSHLVYTSGRHGADYVNKDALYPIPGVISELCEEIARQFSSAGVDVVLAPALGGIILTQWIAHHLTVMTKKSVLAVFAEKIETPEGFVIKRGYEKLIQGKRVLIAEDVLTTGGSVKKVVELAGKLGAQVVGVAALCNRGGIRAQDIGTQVLFSLTEFSLESWEPSECPMCKKGIPIHTTLGKGAQSRKAP